MAEDPLANYCPSPGGRERHYQASQPERQKAQANRCLELLVIRAIHCPASWEKERAIQAIRCPEMEPPLAKSYPWEERAIPCPKIRVPPSR